MRMTLLFGFGVGVAAAAAAVGQDGPQVLRRVEVYNEPGRFAGWPANNGIWSWGDEIVVGFTLGYHKQKSGHPIDPDRPSGPRQARSRDGGVTWVIETPTYVAEDGTEREPAAFSGRIDFAHPDFAARFRNDRFCYSLDRCRTWEGPFRLPTFGRPGLLARTDYLVEGKQRLTAFVAAEKEGGGEGQPLCIRTTELESGVHPARRRPELGPRLPAHRATGRRQPGHGLLFQQRFSEGALHRRRHLERRFDAVTRRAVGFQRDRTKGRMMPPTDETVAEAYVAWVREQIAKAARVIEHCLSQLTDEQVSWRPHGSMNSIGNLVLHLCGNVRQWIVSGVGGAADVRNRPQEFAERGPFERDELLRRVGEAAQQADQVLAAVSPLRLLERRRIQGFDATGLSAILDSVAHFKGHTQEIVGLTRWQLGDAYRFQWTPSTPEQGAPPASG